MVPRMWSPDCYTSGKRLPDTTPREPLPPTLTFPCSQHEQVRYAPHRLDEHQTILVVEGCWVSADRRMSVIQRSELRPRKPTPAACFFHVSRDFRSLRGRQILVRSQLLLHLAAFWRVESLLDFFTWSERCARLVRRARASAQVRRDDKHGENERASHWCSSLGEAPLEPPVPHSITSSARASSDGGTVRPSAFAVLRLTTISNRVGCWIGRSPGFSPARILTTYSAVARY